MTMIAVKVRMKITQEPLKRTPVVLRLDADGSESEPVYTDRLGVARFERPAASGKVLVGGIERYHGRLDGEIMVDLWSVTQSGDESSGAPGLAAWGSTAYPGMSTDRVMVEGREVLTDSEGYLVDPGDWSEGFARAQAQKEGLRLGEEHWQLIRFLRAHDERHGAQATVRDMIRHFRRVWGPSKGNNRYLHDLFPRGGPQKQGNRLAGLLRTKGEH
jgi:tRNA 2-thiouridine synthesizing protein E